MRRTPESGENSPPMLLNNSLTSTWARRGVTAWRDAAASAVAAGVAWRWDGIGGAVMRRRCGSVPGIWT